MKFITVGELKAKLADYSDSLVVAVYVQVGEDMDLCTDVKLETKGHETLHCKGDHMLEDCMGLNLQQILVIC